MSNEKQINPFGKERTHDKKIKLNKRNRKELKGDK